MTQQLDIFSEEKIEPSNHQDQPYSWSRISDNNYEVSSKGDTRFSALFAKLSDGRTIEEAYQLDIKGYRAESDDWHAGKGKKPLLDKSEEQLWLEYKELWVRWANENKELINELADKSKGKVLTDMFAWTPVSQARALCEILNEKALIKQQTQKKVIF